MCLFVLDHSTILIVSTNRTSRVLLTLTV